MNQHEWVYGCYAYYLENYIEPGNPEDGEWHDCHWPVPKCLGGTKTILLLKEHHAVHGVLQSEEWGHPCIWGWEMAYLRGDLLDLGRKWVLGQRSRAGRCRWANLSPEERTEIALRSTAALTPEELSERSRSGWEGLTEEQKECRKRGLRPEDPEDRSNRVRKSNAARSPEQRRSIARKAGAARWANTTPEERSEAARRREAAKRARREAT